MVGSMVCIKWLAAPLRRHLLSDRRRRSSCDLCDPCACEPTHPHGMETRASPAALRVSYVPATLALVLLASLARCEPGTFRSPRLVNEQQPHYYEKPSSAPSSKSAYQEKLPQYSSPLPQSPSGWIQDSHAPLRTQQKPKYSSSVPPQSSSTGWVEEVPAPLKDNPKQLHPQYSSSVPQYSPKSPSTGWVQETSAPLKDNPKQLHPQYSSSVPHYTPVGSSTAPSTGWVQETSPAPLKHPGKGSKQLHPQYSSSIPQFVAPSTDWGEHDSPAPLKHGKVGKKKKVSGGKWAATSVVPIQEDQAPESSGDWSHEGSSWGGPDEASHDGSRIQFHVQGHKGPKSYRFGYDTGKGKHRHFRYEERDHDGVVRGRYGFKDHHGHLRVFHYTAHPHHGYTQHEDKHHH